MDEPELEVDTLDGLVLGGDVVDELELGAVVGFEVVDEIGIAVVVLHGLRLVFEVEDKVEVVVMDELVVVVMKGQAEKLFICPFSFIKSIICD